MSRYRPLTQITRLVIHCSDTPNGRPYSAADIDQWHRQRKFSRAHNARYGLGPWEGRGLHAPDLGAIGYHFVIRTDGVVECGRRLTEIGAHEQRANRNGIGVLLIGRDAFTRKQWRVLRKHVESTQRWRRLHRLPPLEVIGHHELDKHRTCPGFDVQAWLKGGMKRMLGHVVDEKK